MIVTSPLPIVAIEPQPMTAPAGEAARALAAGYLRYASSCWRGDQCAAAFPLRLSAYWQPEMPPEPVAAPAAVSPHGAAGRGIRWYETGQEVRGYVAGRPCGFQVSARAVAKLVRCAFAA